MSLVQQLGSFFHGWTDNVAAAIIGMISYFSSARVIKLIEQENGRFALESIGKTGTAPAEVALTDGALVGSNLAPLLRGSRIEIDLRPTRFLFRPLELPSRAADFLEGIVRAQIDRLTPWSAGDAVFGCTAPVANAGGNITTMVAATTRKTAIGYVEAASEFHPASVAVYTHVGEPARDRVKVFEQQARGHLNANKLSRALRLGLGAVAAFAAVALVISTYLASRLAAQEDELALQVSQRRAVIRASSDADARSPLGALERRKSELPASVIVLEALSKVLPDHTYVSEMHLAGNKLQVVGITRDAPSLIPAIEQSEHFARATFYAPTTRSPSDPGERFHIEAQIEPKNAP